MADNLGHCGGKHCPCEGRHALTTLTTVQLLCLSLLSLGAVAASQLPDEQRSGFSNVHRHHHAGQGETVFSNQDLHSLIQQQAAAVQILQAKVEALENSKDDETSRPLIVVSKRSDDITTETLQPLVQQQSALVQQQAADF